MHLLVSMNNNLEEWRNTLLPTQNAPRLPLAYAPGVAFAKQGHKLSAVDTYNSVSKTIDPYPFEEIYHVNELSQAMKKVDIVSLWAGLGISAVFKQLFLPYPKIRVLLNTFIFRLNTMPLIKAVKLGVMTRIASRFAKGVVVMTSEQYQIARQRLPSSIPVMKFVCGIDTSFFRPDATPIDIPDNLRSIVDKLLSAPYVIMVGEELRCNRDALDIAAAGNLRLVRVSQYSEEENTWLKQQIYKRGLSERFFLFEKVSYPFLRFLLQNASAYAGLVDSTWQPAGWTSACEAMACGLPVVIYEGLVSRELIHLGAGNLFMKSISMNDTKSFRNALESIPTDTHRHKIKRQIRLFANNRLNLEITGELFVKEIERIAIVDLYKYGY